jgi:hypothetical protein
VFAIAMGNAFRVPWSWNDVTGKDDATKRIVADLDRAFAAKDIQVHYVVTILLTAIVWALLITIHVVGDLNAAKDLVVTVFSLILVGLALVVSVRRVWIIKYNMLHPALQLLQPLGGGAGSGVVGTALVQSAASLLRGASSSSVGTHFFGTFVGFLVIGVMTLLAGAICLIVSSSTVGVGIALSVVTTALFISSVAFYRRHVGVHLALVDAGQGTSPYSLP